MQDVRGKHRDQLDALPDEAHRHNRLCELNAPEGVSQPAMTQLVTRLEREGLVERASDPTDGRAVVVTVTEAGRTAVARRREGRARALADLLRGLPEEDHAAILAALPAIERLGDLAG